MHCSWCGPTERFGVNENKPSVCICHGAKPLSNSWFCAHSSDDVEVSRCNPFSHQSCEFFAMMVLSQWFSACLANIWGHRWLCGWENSSSTSDCQVKNGELPVSMGRSWDILGKHSIVRAAWNRHAVRSILFSSYISAIYDVIGLWWLSCVLSGTMLAPVVHWWKWGFHCHFHSLRWHEDCLLYLAVLFLLRQKTKFRVNDLNAVHISSLPD